MSKYKEESSLKIKNVSQGWTKDIIGDKYYRKDNWVITYRKNFGIAYFIIDESYNYSCYGTRNKQDFLEEKHMLKVKNSLVWRALHGEPPFNQSKKKKVPPPQIKKTSILNALFGSNFKFYPLMCTFSRVLTKKLLKRE